MQESFFIDNNPRVIELLVFLSKQPFQAFLETLEKMAEQYHLSNSFRYGYTQYRLKCQNSKDNNGLKDYNKTGYYELRNAYNSLADKTTEQANTMLYLLMLYAFNNDIRFNANGDFNLPIGKTDLNKMNMIKLEKYIERIGQIDAEFICDVFDSEQAKQKVAMADFIYMDPPYLVGDAVYNMTWSSAEEYRLLEFMDELLSQGKNFALSNVIAKVGKRNEPLSYWCYKNNDAISVHPIDYNYRSASYNKIIREAKEQEVLITNKEISNEN